MGIKKHPKWQNLLVVLHQKHRIYSTDTHTPNVAGLLFIYISQCHLLVIHSSQFHSSTLSTHQISDWSGLYSSSVCFSNPYAEVTAWKPAGAPQNCASAVRRSLPPQIGAVTMIPQGDGVDVPEVKSKRPTGTFIYMPLHCI